MQLDKPNFKVPLAFSYNTRGMAEFTNMLTNALDQRKINAFYKLAQNAVTGGAKVYTIKRPGVTNATDSYGESTQTAYLVTTKPGAVDGSDPNKWVFSTDGNDVRVSDNSSTSVIVTASGYVPTYIDRTRISGTDTLVLQLNNGSAQRTFYGSALGSWTEITDSTFTGITHVRKMEHLDGFALIMDSTNKIYWSNLNTLATWDDSDYITKQIEQDIPSGLMRLGKQIIASGRNTLEVFTRTSSGRTILQSVPALAQKVGSTRGAAAGIGHYYANIGGRLFFVGHEGDARGAGVFAYDGQRVERVSNQFIDGFLNSLAFTTSVNIFSQNAFTVFGKQCFAIAIDSAGAATQRSLVFVPSWNEWFEWNSTVFKTIGDGTHFIGVGSNQHKLYRFGDLDGVSALTDNYQDDSTNYDRVLQFKIPFDDNGRKFVRWLGVVGTQERTACTESVSISFDDGQNWTSLGTLNLVSDKPHIYRCGSGRNIHVRLTLSSNHEGRHESFVARID